MKLSILEVLADHKKRHPDPHGQPCDYHCVQQLIADCEAALAQQAQSDHHLRRNPHNNQDWCGSCNSYSCQAQQAQPLTDEQMESVEAKLRRQGRSDAYIDGYLMCLRDRMAQQTQPEMRDKMPCESGHACSPEYGWPPTTDGRCPACGWFYKRQ